MRIYKLCKKCKNKENYWCQDVKIDGKFVCACKHILAERGIKTIGQKLSELNKTRKELN